MERINLYRYKKPILKFSSFLVLVIVLLAPVFATKFTTEFYKQAVLSALKAKYGVVLSKYGFDLTPSGLHKQYADIKRQNDLLYAESKRLQDRITLLENHLYDYSVTTVPIKILLNSWEKNDSNWLVLLKLSLDAKRFGLTFHELYFINGTPSYEKILNMLSSYYKVSRIVEYETVIPFLNKKITKVTISGSR